ncbi:MAG: tryptophan-rich sensory protein [Bacteroidetes bacterium]|nr:tryptophan-rich sensory protein [Bacteroidota bacterium]HET6243097.1 TspO/MBR family protein [Bacteroidia bacterium]
MSYWIKIIIFLALNFGALVIGSFFTGPGASSEWYQSLNKAPWTPPGFVFGLAWFTIMLCFSFFMANITEEKQALALNTILIAYALQWLFNVIWNPLFFKLQLPALALIDISLLFLAVTYFVFIGFKHSIVNALLILPYFLWLVIAVSLNAFIVLMN